MSLLPFTTLLRVTARNSGAAAAVWEKRGVGTRAEGRLRFWVVGPHKPASIALKVRMDARQQRPPLFTTCSEEMLRQDNKFPEFPPQMEKRAQRCSPKRAQSPPSCSASGKHVRSGLDSSPYLCRCGSGFCCRRPRCLLVSPPPVHAARIRHGRARRGTEVIDYGPGVCARQGLHLPGLYGIGERWGLGGLLLLLRLLDYWLCVPLGRRCDWFDRGVG